MGEIAYKAENDTHKLIVRYDEDAESPREWGNLGKMICFHGRYDLGDKHDYKSPEDLFLDLLDDSHDELVANDGFTSRLYYFWKQVIVDDGDLVDDLAIQFLGIMEDETYPKLGDEFPAARFGRMIAEANSVWIDEFLDDAEEGELQDILDSLDKYIILPLYLYDHGGITMRTNPFSCPWDSGQVGWIYASKQKFIDETGYSEAELFSTDSKRTPVIGERVKVEGRDDWGEVTENVIALDGSPGYTVNFDYNKYLGARKPENLVIVPQHEITEVMANRAEQMLINEVETYDLYIRGECYGYRLYELKTCEHCGATSTKEIDSCWGFFADTLADLKEQMKYNVPSEFHNLVDSLKYR
ncbi:MAG TPA: hypothetical protein PK684_04600 [Bacillota bacterium]|nr:hypothetical protein [Bacillota bacterium]